MTNLTPRQPRRPISDGSRPKAQLTYLVGAAFVGIAYQPYIFMLIGLQCGLWSYVKRTSSEPAKASFKRPGSGELAREA